MPDVATIARPGTPLTPAEVRALEAMRYAASEAEAAAAIGISPHTLHVQLRTARARLGVRSTRHAVAKLDDITRSVG